MKTNFSAESLATLISKRIGRRSFMGRALPPASGAALAMTAFPHRATAATTATPADVAILKFLAAAELIEADLWQQYCELAAGNPSYRLNLMKIKTTLPDYVCGDFYDELSHAEFINAYLELIGEDAVNLDAFRTLPGPQVRGALNIGRLTNLSALTIDTTYYNRYRSDSNPDLGDMPPEKVLGAHRGLRRTPSDRLNPRDALAVAQTAAFHFGSIEQGGSSLYNNLLQNVTSLDAVSILGSIGPTEVYHLGLFFKSLEGISAVRGKAGNTLVTFPNIRVDPTRAQVTPHPAKFISSAYPLTSVIRPSSKAKAGAAATVTFLANSGLFTGQPQAFLDAATNLATAADAAGRNGATPV